MPLREASAPSDRECDLLQIAASLTTCGEPTSNTSKQMPDAHDAIGYSNRGLNGYEKARIFSDETIQFALEAAPPGSSIHSQMRT